MNSVIHTSLWKEEFIGDFHKDMGVYIGGKKGVSGGRLQLERKNRILLSPQKANNPREFLPAYGCVYIPALPYIQQILKPHFLAKSG